MSDINNLQSLARQADRFIREAMNAMSFPILLAGIELVNIKVKELYKDLGYKSMNQYISQLSQDKKKSVGRIYSWLNIGQIYYKHQNDLKAIDFCEEDGPSKLLVLEQALIGRKTKEVFHNIKNLSYRDFLFYAQENKLLSSITEGVTEDVAADNGKNGSPGGKVHVNGKWAVKINPDLDEQTFSFLNRINLIAKDALEDGEKVYYLRVKDEHEYRLYEKALNNLIQKLRRKTGYIDKPKKSS